MNSCWRTDAGTKRRLFQGVVILFLLYTAFDITIPQYHRNESIRSGESIVASGTGTSQTEQLASESMPSDSREDREHPRDEDCFCCCSHVVPSPLFVDIVGAIVNLPTHSEADTSIPSAPLHTPYHPPRFA